MSMDIDGEYKCVAENSAGTAETAAKITVEGKRVKLLVSVSGQPHSIFSICLSGTCVS